jgi:hypothetical protein
MTHFVPQLGWQFRQIVACLLLVTFAPIAVLSEGVHLIPGLGTCCQSVGTHHHSSSPNGCSHDQDFDFQHQNFEMTPNETCVVCEFCSLFNSSGFVSEGLQEPQLVSVIDFLEPVFFFGEFFSLFLARAPPVAV